MGTLNSKNRSSIGVVVQFIKQRFARQSVVRQPFVRQQLTVVQQTEQHKFNGRPDICGDGDAMIVERINHILCASSLKIVYDIGPPFDHYRRQFFMKLRDHNQSTIFDKLIVTIWNNWSKNTCYFLFEVEFYSSEKFVKTLVFSVALHCSAKLDEFAMAQAIHIFTNFCKE